ncbi:hypothetical protein I4U23_025734 [Adineta vaga]|nr:hypothetical protein I4U23_025734 [Adineta vaga]
MHTKRSHSNGSLRRRNRCDLICVVCHAPAMGYNFDQITCESCKAFFRRNALDNMNKFKCRVGTNDCPITLETRKKCKYCRLKKCFQKGLRKEWIMSEEEKLTKKRKIEDNRRLREMSMLSTSASSLLTPLDGDYSQSSCNKCDDSSSTDSNEFKYSLDENIRISLTRIEEHYRQAVQLNIAVIKGSDSPCLRCLDGIVDVVNEPAHVSCLRLVTFFKLTPEFSSLNEHDRLVLVKHNLITISCFHFCICTDTETEIFREPGTTNDCCYEARALRTYSDSVYHRIMDWTRKLQNLCSNDHLIFKLMILISIFSKGADYAEPPLVESTKAFFAQNIFVDILWNYLNVRFGNDQTSVIFSHLIFSCMKAHSIARETKGDVAKKTSQSADELAPLMQSVLQIS